MNSPEHYEDKEGDKHADTCDSERLSGIISPIEDNVERFARGKCEDHVNSQICNDKGTVEKDVAEAKKHGGACKVDH